MTDTAADRLFADHQHLALAVARRMARCMPRRIDPDELFTAGLFGLWKAAQRFEPARQLLFATYAERRIRGAILDWLRTSNATRCKAPLPDRLSEDYDSPGREAPVGHALEIRDQVAVALRVVDGRHRQAVQLYYLKGLNMAAVARRISRTETRVSQLLAEARSRMRERLEREGVSCPD